MQTPGLSRAGFLLPPPGSGRPGRLLILGWDGADWDVLDPLLEAGALPHLAGLLARGCRAPLASLEPRLSPLLWTSAVTGVTPDTPGAVATIATFDLIVCTGVLHQLAIPAEGLRVLAGALRPPAG